jgi:hypothetical protein
MTGNRLALVRFQPIIFNFVLCFVKCKLIRMKRELIKEKVGFAHKLEKLILLINESRNKEAIELAMVYCAREAVDVELLKRELKPNNKT